MARLTNLASHYRVKLYMHPLKKRILVVEDDADTRQNLASLLEREGYQTDTAEDGQQALDRLQHGFRPDLILLDLAMPVMDGWQLSVALQQDARLSSIPMIVVSGIERAREEAAALGAVGLLTKPIALDHLLDSVRRWSPRQHSGILVVDDEPAVRRLLELALDGQGFKVWQAADGREAVEVYRRERDAIGLVLLDVRMPGLDGPGALRALREINPELRCCFMSGNTGAYTIQQLLDLGASHFFQKPLGLAELVKALRNLLEAPAAPV